MEQIKGGKAMKHTPRTDAKSSGENHFMGDWVDAQFARQLERELNLSKARCKLLGEFETKLSAVMPIDFKDWHQNSKNEWPEVAALVISSLRERIEELENELWVKNLTRLPGPDSNQPNK